MQPKLVLPAAMQRQIIQESLAGAPEEICGIVRGRDGVAKELVPSVNVAEERTINYLVEPGVLMKQFVFEDEGDEMTAIYHSHPESEAYPSATDAWSAHYPDTQYIICSLAETQPVIRSFLLQDIEPEIDIIRLSDDLEFYETRPGLFAYFHAAGTARPSALKHLDAGADHAFYVVYAQSDPAEEPEVRCVRVEEVRVSTA